MFQAAAATAATTRDGIQTYQGILKDLSTYLY